MIVLLSLLSCADSADVTLDGTADRRAGGDDTGALEYEGDAAGECLDGADNDRDGDYDCDDADCAGAPDCADDTGSADTDTGSADTDTGSADTDTGSADTGSADTDTGSADTDTGSADTDTDTEPDTDVPDEPEIDLENYCSFGPCPWPADEIWITEWPGTGGTYVYASGKADPLEISCPSWVTVSAPASIDWSDGRVWIVFNPTDYTVMSPQEGTCTIGDEVRTVRLCSYLPEGVCS